MDAPRHRHQPAARARRAAAVAVALGLVLTACGTDEVATRSPATADGAATATEPAATADATGSTDDGTADEPTTTTGDGGHDDVDLTALPLGDGAVSDGPEAGHVWACATTFGGGGAQATGTWIDEATGTYDLTAKVEVEGSVTWPSVLEVAVDGALRAITGNGLPDHATGEYPVAAGTEAAGIDRNPNAISTQDLDWDLPADPQVADEPSCLPMGAIGVLTTGAVVFNALDARGEDAVAHEVQDACQGHPERSGQYHYHSLTTCLEDGSDGTHSELVGWALDGFGLYGRYGEDGTAVTNADLDACHGHTHGIEVDGAEVEQYHYHATWEYPYTLGCFVGVPLEAGTASSGR